jgi:hypothetical protein
MIMMTEQDTLCELYTARAMASFYAMLRDEPDPLMQSLMWRDRDRVEQMIRQAVADFLNDGRTLH